MTAITLDRSSRTAAAATPHLDPATWRVAALALLSVRFIQGFIYWGGGSRRFIYAPSKLDPSAPSWMANKFQSALPGALLGTDHVIGFLLHHFYVLYAAVIVFSAGELIAGAFLIAGLLTRGAALASVGFSIVLMLMFGWQGATCIDEWTMAASNLAMGVTLMLAGGGIYAADTALLRRYPSLRDRTWFRWLSGAMPLPLPERGFRRLALLLFGATVMFNVATYQYYRGSVVTPFHGGPVSAARHHLSLSDASVSPDGSVRFTAYLDGGTPAVPSNIMTVALLARNGAVLEQWQGGALTRLPRSAIVNDYAYNRFAPGAYGLSAKMGARAVISLPPVAEDGATAANAAMLQVRTVNGTRFRTPVTPGTTDGRSAG